MASVQLIKSINDKFPQVIEQVENGKTIAEALTSLGINRGAFYKIISPKQKVELQMAKTANAEFGVYWHFK
jgi:DNA-directed RNA polymerase subunit N (RpoN/RPB10)